MRRSLVLTECVSPVPSDPAAARLLLDHGLRGTDLEAVLAAADSERTELHLCDPRRCYEDLPPDQSALRERAARRQLLSRLGAERLTAGQKQVVEYRRRLLGYRQRLDTYLKLVGSEERYDPAEYRQVQRQVGGRIVKSATLADPAAGFRGGGGVNLGRAPNLGTPELLHGFNPLFFGMDSNSLSKKNKKIKVFWETFFFWGGGGGQTTCWPLPWLGGA